MPDTLEQIADAVGQSSPNEFSTQIHVADKNGPKNNKDGSFRKKGKAASASQVEIVENAAPQPAYAEMGSVTATTLVSSFTMLFGTEWRAEQQEIDAMSMAWAKYYESTGMSEFPPWVMLAMVHAGYIGKRLAMPETKGRFERMRYAFQRWRFKRRYGMYPEEYHARTNSGNDVQRENDPSNQSQ